MRPRNCPICGVKFRPKRKNQRACGRVCGIKLQALVRTGKAPRATPYNPDLAKRYGYSYQKTRAQWKLKVDRGEVHCARCGKWIAPGTPWDLGHDDNDRGVIRGPEHRKCNRATAGRQTQRRKFVAPIPIERSSRIW